MRKDKTKEQIANKIEKSLSVLRRKNVFSGKEIIIFGCTMWIKNLLDYLYKHDIKVSAIVDNNPEKAGGTCQGISVYSPKDYLKDKNGNISILICSGYWYEMSMQLEEMGFHRDKSYYIVDFDISRKKTLIKSLTDINKGYKHYKKLINRLNGKNPYVFVCPWAASGDIYMAGIFLNEYMKKNNIDDYMVLVVGKLAYKTAQLFNMKNVIIITEEEKINIIDAWAFYGSEKIHVKPLLYWGWRLKKHLNPDTKMGVTFLDVMKHDVFNLKENDVPCIPENICDEKAINFFQTNNLKEGQTVIIAPYAGSYNSNVGTDFWEQLVIDLTKRGYSVCTNSAGEHEPVIKGTKGVFFPLSEAVSILNKAGYFIAVRSGLCDIVSSSSCKQIIIYERGLNAVNYNYFSLKKMGLNNDAIEIIYDKEYIEDIYDRIISNF